MKARVAFLVLSGVLVALTGSGCGGGDDAGAAPTAEELAAQLLTPDDLEGAWSVTVPDSDVEVSNKGVGEQTVELTVVAE